MPINELGEFQRNTLYLTVLSTSDIEKEQILAGAGGEALWGAALEPGAEAADTLDLFLLPTGRPGRRFADADDEATRDASFGLFLLPRGRPRPCFSISTLVPRLASPASAIRKAALGGKEKS
jgi:hypothetical protein